MEMGSQIKTEVSAFKAPQNPLGEETLNDYK